VTIIFFYIIFLFSSAPVHADTIHLKNGQAAEGLITRQDTASLDLDLGDTSVTFSNAEIDSIQRSTPEQTAAIAALWEKNKASSRQKDMVAKEQRKKSLEEWRLRTAEEEALKKADARKRHLMEANTRRAPVVVDETGHLITTVLLNGNVPASLVVDTGAPMLLLSAGVAAQLGYPLENMPGARDIVVLNGKHKAAPVVLKSVVLGEAYEVDVPAYVLLDEDPEITGAFKDGLLGLSFIARFHVALDTNNGQLLLRKD